MVYFTGDIHGRADRIGLFCKFEHLTENDIVVLLGDVGANYFGDERDVSLKEELANMKPTFLCIHGNHEQRPDTIPGYALSEWNGGLVWSQKEYPNLLFARDGDIFSIGKYRYLVIGGAYSVDKYIRLCRGYKWWEDEQPSEEAKKRTEKRINDESFDVILSHTCPFKYEPTEMFLPMIKQDTVDDSTERWLDKIEESSNYKAWFCGHWHTDKRIDRMHFLFRSFESESEISHD